jgi:hypothetical protein
MLKAVPARIVALFAIILLPIVVLGQSTIHGNLSGTLGPGTYMVDGDCQVQAGQSLTISPGTTFLHTGHYTWNIYGLLHAVGTASSPIIFTHESPNMSNKWAGIRFQQGASSSSILEWCHLVWSQNVPEPNSQGGAIYSDLVPITVRNCLVDHCNAADGGGIYLNGANNSVIDSCTFTNNLANGGGGIQLNSCSNVQISNCRIGSNSATST